MIISIKQAANGYIVTVQNFVLGGPSEFIFQTFAEASQFIKSQFKETNQ